MRMITTKIWTDKKFRKQMPSIELRYFWLYILSCPSSKVCGIFFLPTETMVAETKLNENKVLEHLEKLKNLGVIDYNQDTEEIIIYNFPRYNINNLGKPMEDCVRKELSLVKDISLIKKMISYLEFYITHRINDKKIKVLSKIIDIYKESINNSITTTITTTNDTCHESLNESVKEEKIDWDELMSHMED